MLVLACTGQGPVVRSCAYILVTWIELNPQAMYYLNLPRELQIFSNLKALGYSDLSEVGTLLSA